MTKPLLWVSLSLLGAVNAFPITVTNLGGGVTATDLANSLLASASGITLVSASYTGSNAASGTFTGGNASGVGIDSGIILTSGLTASLGGGFTDDNGAAGDSLLTAIVGAGTFNASILTITFIPTASNIQFGYVFASREYPEYVNSIFNDVFAFQVNGVNRALVPGTSVPVSINNVNCGEPGATSPGPNPTNCAQFRDNRSGAISSLDVGGFTNLFALTASVNPGVENVLRLAIADTSDEILDSAVFLQGGTLQTCGGPGLPACGQLPVDPPLGSDVPEPGTMLVVAATMMIIGISRRLRR